MALKLLSRFRIQPKAFSSMECSSRLTVEHDRRNSRFTVRLGGGAGVVECATLLYRFTAEKEVELISTFVPEPLRGQGVAALLSRAALDFLLEENLRARVSCWYIQKYIREQPLQPYRELVIT